MSKPHLERIKALTQTARTTWFGYLGALAFAAVALLNVEDEDFFVLDAATQLPLINVSVPVEAFFATGAPLITLIYCYMHVFLMKLWTELGQAPAQIEGQPLAEVIKPWLLSDFALQIRRIRRAEHQAPPVDRTGLALLGGFVSFLLAGVGGPLILFGFWYVSMPAHIFWLTAWTGVLFAITLWFFGASLSAMLRRLGSGGDTRTGLHPAIHIVGLTVLGLATVQVSELRTVKDRLNGAPRPEAYTGFFSHPVHWFRPVQADLAEVHLTVKPPDWSDFATARAQYKSDWCARPDTPDCQAATGDDIMSVAGFDVAWAEHRRNHLRALPKPSLNGRNLDSVDLARAFLPGADLRSTEMRNARLKAAQLQGADLNRAKLQGADLVASDIRVADLSHARMTAADLTAVDAQGARFFGARMSETRLRYARMPGADLRWADLQGADFGGALLDHADFRWATAPGAGFVRAYLQGANFRYAQLQGSNLVRAKMQGVDLSWADMHEVKLLGAELQGAVLDASKLVGTPSDNVMLDGADLRGATNQGGALRFVDLSAARIDPSTDFRNSFGDNTVSLPPQMARPCQWGPVDVDLTDDQFWGRWRGWLEAFTPPADGDIWEEIAPKGFETVIPIAPPEGCVWKTGPAQPNP